MNSRSRSRTWRSLADAPRPTRFACRSTAADPISTSDSRVSKRCPAVANYAVASGIAGPLEVTPDHNGIVSAVPRVAGLFVLAGFSGHGYMLSPAVGRVMAEMVLGREPSLPVEPLAFDRFETAAGADGLVI